MHIHCVHCWMLYETFFVVIIVVVVVVVDCVSSTQQRCLHSTTFSVVISCNFIKTLANIHLLSVFRKCIRQQPNTIVLLLDLLIVVWFIFCADTWTNKQIYAHYCILLRIHIKNDERQLVDLLIYEFEMTWFALTKFKTC